MGNAAEVCAKECNISREEQDEFAIESYKRAQNAQEKGYFDNEMIKVKVTDRRGNVTIVEKDEEVARVKFEKIPSLRPVFDKEGTVTAANASSINDGAAAVLVMSADKAKEFLRDESVETGAQKSYVTFQPIGIVLAVMPWNFPFWQVFRFAAPALVAGNIAILKHASNVPQCALALEEVFRKAGFPDNIFTTLMIGARMVESVIRHPAVKAVTLTGSENAGRKVAGVAGSELKKTVLELGGADAFIVLDSANMKNAVQGAVAGRFLNMGQSCIAAKRFIIVESLKKEFEDLVKNYLSIKKIEIGKECFAKEGPI